MSGPHQDTISSANNIPGILLMVLGVFLMSVMDVLAKFLVEADYSALQIITIRGWIITLSLLGWLTFRGQLGSLKTERARHHAARSILGFGATILFFTALGEMPLTDAIVILFASPFFMTAMSIPLLKETVGPYRWLIYRTWICRRVNRIAARWGLIPNRITVCPHCLSNVLVYTNNDTLDEQD